MVSNVEDRRRNAYETATTLSQAMLDETFRGGENQLEAIGTLTKTVDATTYTLRFSERPKFVGDYFYEGRARFPRTKRTMGEPQTPAIQFAQFEVELANMDGYYNEYLEGGDNFISWIGAELEIQVGLRDVASSFFTVFSGFVPEEDGFEVTRESISIRATDRFNDLNKKSPLPYISDDPVDGFPSAPEDVLGKTIPFVLGDWEAGFNVTAGATFADVDDGAGATLPVAVSRAESFYGGVPGYYVGGGVFVFSIGGVGSIGYTPDTISNVLIKRGETLLETVLGGTPGVGDPVSAGGFPGYWCAQITALKGYDGGADAPYYYQSGDIACISVKVPYDTGKYSNVIEIAEQILLTLGGRVSGDLDSTSWTAYKTKNTPAQSDFTSIKGRKWIGEDKDSVLKIVLELLEEVRMEMFINASGKIALRSLHPEDFTAPAAATRIDQFEINETTVAVKAAENLYFNQAQMSYAYTPITDKTQLSTVQYKNADSISKSGKTVIKVIDCPSLYVTADAVNQLKEFIRLYSADLRYVECTVCWVHLIRDLGEFVALNFDQGSLAYESVPMQIRDVGINLDSIAVTLRLLSYATFPYSGYAPANAARFLSSSSQTIDIA